MCPTLNDLLVERYFARTVFGGQAQPLTLTLTSA